LEWKIKAMLGTICVVAAALFYGAIGVSAIMRPKHLLRGFSIEAAVSESRNEIRAVYGGFPLAVAGLLLFSLTQPELSDGILTSLSICSAGMAFGRILSALMDKTIGKHPLVFLILEVIVAVLIAINIKGL
jgi:dolichol kinase